jgi:hypothetical protein
MTTLRLGLTNHLTPLKNYYRKHSRHPSVFQSKKKKMALSGARVTLVKQENELETD